MNKIIIAVMVMIYGVASGISGKAQAQVQSHNPDPIPKVWRIEGLWRPAAPGPLSLPEKARAYSPAVDFEPGAKSWHLTETISPFGSRLKFLTPFLTLSNSSSSDKSAPALGGLKVGSGLSFFLPVSNGLAAFAQVNPRPKNLFSAPQTMITTGFHIPIIRGTPAGGNFALKFSTAVDQKFRPIFSFILTTMPFQR